MALPPYRQTGEDQDKRRDHAHRLGWQDGRDDQSRAERDRRHTGFASSHSHHPVYTTLPAAGCDGCIEIIQKSG